MNPAKPEDHWLTNNHAQSGTLCVAVPSKLRRLAASALLCLAALVSAAVQAQMVAVIPMENTNAIANPLMGFREDFTAFNARDWNARPYQTVARHYIYWRDIENLQTDGVQKIKDFCNQTWAGCEAANMKIIPRVILQYGDGQYYFPSYLTNGDWTSQATRTAVTNMIRKLGEAWDNDPRVAWVQTGIIGKWGEQENPVDVSDPVVNPDNSTWAEIMGEAFANAFPNKMILARNNEAWDDSQELGVYWDSFANYSKMNGPTDPYPEILNRNASPYNRYLVSPIEGEVAYGSFEPSKNPGGSPNETVSTPQAYNWLIDVIRATHTSALGWVSSYSLSDPANTLGANLIQKAFGYRFLINEFQCSQRAEPGGTLNLNFKVINTGSTPMYENWPVAFVLINQSTRQIAWKTTLSGINITTWRPGSNYDWTPTELYQSTGSRTYLTPAATNQISDSVTVPSSLPTGEYLAGIAILDPTTQLPGVFFAVKNFFKESQTQPLVRIGIGVDASSHALSGVAFDDPVANDARYYSTNQVGGVTVEVTATDASAGEPSDGGTFTFTRSVVTNAALTVNFIVSGTATSGSDYQSLGTSVVIPAGQASVTKTVSVIDDPTYEGGETVVVSLSFGAGYSIGAPNSATVSIADDEVFVGEAAPWLEDFGSQTNGATSDGPPTSWVATPATGNFRVLNGEMAFNDSTSNGVFTTGAINISSGPVTVSLKVRGGGGLDVGQDYLRFYKKVDGGPEEQLGAADGPQAEATWTGNITTGTSLVLVVRARVTAPAEYYYFDDLHVDTGASVTPVVTVSATDASAAEPGNDGTFTFTRSGSTSGDLTVNFTVGGTATSGTDYQSVGTSVTILTGQTTATKTVTVIDDITVEGAETTIVTLAASPDYTIGSPSGATVSIADDDGFGGESVPWIETFSLADGSNSNGIPTSWTATRPNGIFHVSGNRLMINQGGTNNAEGVFETAEINISGGSVKVSLEVQSQGVDSSDYVRFYKIVDGGAPVLINQGAIVGITNFVGTNINGSTLKLRIATRVSFGDEYYYFDNLKVEHEVPNWVQPPVLQGGQLRLEWVGGTLQTTTNLAGPWGDVSGAVSPHLHPATNPAQFFRVKQ